MSSYSREGFGGNLPLTRNWGNADTPEEAVLIRQLDDMYTEIANAVNRLVKKNVISGANPPANDQRNSFFSVGDITVRTDTNAAWIMTSRTTANAVTWTLIS